MASPEARKKNNLKYLIAKRIETYRCVPKMASPENGENASGPFLGTKFLLLLLILVETWIFRIWAGPA